MRCLFFFAFATLTGIVAVRSQTTNAFAPSTASAVSAPAASPSPPPSAPAKKSISELEKLVEPIALHPDPLIAIILPAAAYPLEIVQAARFVKDTNNVAKVDSQPWDDNVKAVAKFPEVITKMDADLPWTIDLGNAFVNQPKELMDAIQKLRSMAQKAGNLKTTEQQIVTVTNVVVQETSTTEVVSAPTTEIIQIAPANPAVIYVPSYPPAIYYPWYPYYPYAAPLLSFGAGFAWGAFWGAAWHNSCNWGHGHVDIDSNRNVNRDVNRNVDRGRNTDRAQARDRGANTRGRDGGGRQAWQPNQNRRQQSGANRGNREARGWSSSQTRAQLASGGSRPSTGNLGSRPNTGTVGSRPSAGTGSRGSAGSGISSPRPTGRSTTGARPSTSPSTSRGSSYSGRSSSGGNSAFNRSSGGSGARSSSYRGSSSRGGGGFSGGGGRRGGGGGRR